MHPRTWPVRVGALLLQTLLLLVWSGGALCLAGPATGSAGAHSHDHAAMQTAHAVPGNAHTHAGQAHSEGSGPLQGMHVPPQSSLHADLETGPGDGGPPPPACTMMLVCSTPAVAAPVPSAPSLAQYHRAGRVAEAPLMLHSVAGSPEPPPPRA